MPKQNKNKKGKKKTGNKISVEIYTHRKEGRSGSCPALLVNDSTDYKLINTKNKRKSILNFYAHVEGIANQKVNLMGIKSTLSGISGPQPKLIATPIHIPAFFEETPVGKNGKKQSFTGIFLADINADFLTNKKKKQSDAFTSFTDFECKKIGSHDCPHRIILGDLDTGISHFTFNGQVFFPLLTRGFVVIYYVADEGSKDFDWDYETFENGKNPDYGSGMVAVNSPIYFEPALGIFVTRNAKLMPLISK